MPFDSGVNSSTKSSLDLKAGLCLCHCIGKKEALIKILYHGYLQAILQQERIEGACFHKRASQGVAHNQSVMSKLWCTGGWGGVGGGA